MTQTETIGKHNTSITMQDGYIIVKYWNTEVVKFNDSEIILNSGGFLTTSTKTRINQVSNQYGLGFKAIQEKGKWFIEHKGEKLKFVDNMKIPRSNISRK